RYRFNARGRLLPASRPRSSLVFQAGGGIRAGHVTGVQTCALPISPTRSASIHVVGVTRVDSGAHMCVAERVGGRNRRDGRAGGKSEERRVGKEGRCRWSGNR